MAEQELRTQAAIEHSNEQFKTEIKEKFEGLGELIARQEERIAEQEKTILTQHQKMLEQDEKLAQMKPKV